MIANGQAGELGYVGAKGTQLELLTIFWGGILGNGKDLGLIAVVFGQIAGLCFLNSNLKSS